MDGNKLPGVTSQVLQMFTKSNNYKDYGRKWLLLGDTLEKHNEKLTMLNRRFKAKCTTQRGPLGSIQTPHLLQPEDGERNKETDSGFKYKDNGVQRSWNSQSQQVRPA